MTQILIVDDDRIMVKLLKIQLAQKGFDINAAYDGETAWDMINHPATMPDIVILDVGLPGMNGIELLGMIKKNKMTKHIAVLMLTTENKIESLSKTLNTGIIDYVIKPATLDQIMSRLLKVHRKFRSGTHELEKREIKIEEPEVNLFKQAVENRLLETSSLKKPARVMDNVEARKNISVLLVEAFAANQHSLSKAIDALGYSVHTVSGESQEDIQKNTLAILSNQKIHIVIIDSEESFVDGYQLTHAIKMQDREQNKMHTIIGIGDESKTAEGKRWLKAGMDDYYQKPVPVKTVADAIYRFAEESIH